MPMKRSGLLRIAHFTVLHAVSEVDNQAYGQPNKSRTIVNRLRLAISASEMSMPIIGTNGTHGVLKGRTSFWPPHSHNPDTRAHNHESKQRADTDQLAESANRHQRSCYGNQQADVSRSTSKACENADGYRRPISTISRRAPWNKRREIGRAA